MIMDEQFKNRHEYIGGSDITVILNQSKFKKPWDLLLEKASIKTSDFGGNVYSEMGNILEPRIQRGLNLINVDEVTYKKEYEGVPFECHIDGLNQEKSQIQEIKVTSQTIDECLNTYEWQIRCYMYVVGLKEARLIQLQRAGALKQLSSYIVKKYNFGNLHDFSTLDDIEVNEAKAELVEHIANINLSTGMLNYKFLNHDSKKEELMLTKTKLFWEFRNRLIDDPDLHKSQEFKKEFEISFNQ